MQKKNKLIIKLKQASSEANKKNYIKSISLCKSIIKKQPNEPTAYKLLTTNFIALKRYDEVESTLKKVLAIVSEEESYTYHHLLGCNYISLKDNHTALEVLEALFNKTGDSKILLDIALAYYNLGEYESARDVYFKLIELEPNNHQAKFNLYPILLHFKDYKNAWVCFHSRLERQEIKDQVHWFAPKWNGESLEGKNILIYPEQGIGDNLYYTGCFAEAIVDAAQTHIVCDNRLKVLLQYNFPRAFIHSYQDVNTSQNIEANFDCQILAGSLSYLYRPDQESFTKQVPLSIEPNILRDVSQKLSTHKLRIGLSWFHGRVNDGNEYSMFLEELLPMLKIEGIEWVNLQFGDWQKEVKQIEEKHGISITHIEECSAAGDFNQYGALIANLDLVISASNAAHMLAVRLGVKNWMYLPGKRQALQVNASQSSLSTINSQVFYNELEGHWGKVIESFCLQLRSLPELSGKGQIND